MLDETSGDMRELPIQDFALHESHRYIVNVGSVGDPRDGRILASYCIYDSASRVVSHRSVAFDIDAFRADIDAVRLPSVPYFLRCLDKQASEERRVQDWSVDVRTLDRPKKRIVIRRIRNEIADTEQARLEAARERARRSEIQRTLQGAKEAREARARARLKTAAAERLKCEAEERVAADARRQETQRTLARVQEEQRTQALVKANVLAERNRERVQTKAREQQEKAERLRQRKRELAQAVEHRTQDQRVTREAEREAERERVRKQLLKIQQIADAKKKSPPS